MMMRSLFRLMIALSAVFLAIRIGYSQPLITTTIGDRTSTSKVGYFVLDFDDSGAKPETYAFAWNYEGTKTGTDFLLALQSALTGPKGFQQDGVVFPGLGYAVQTIGYNGRNQSSDTNPNGYWNLWLGIDGKNWTSSQFGSDSVILSDTPVFTQNELSGSSWQGWRWVNDFNTDIAQAPRTPFLAAAAPEPGMIGYALLSLGCGVLTLRKKCR